MRPELLLNYERDAANAAKKIYFIKDGGLKETSVPEALQRLAAVNEFGGEAGAVLAGEHGVLLGVGDGSDPFISAAAAEKLPEDVYVFADTLDERAATLASLGWLMGTYRFNRYKQQKQAAAKLVAPANADPESIRRAGGAIALVRDLVNTPASDMGPAALEQAARNLAEECSGQIEVTTGDDLLAQNLPMIHAVGRASVSAPRLIDLTWGDPAAPKLTLVGKGVTFDSGGLNIKGPAGMALMKKDMGGGAHTLALARMIMSAKLNVRLRALVPAVENAISGDAFRPGDILPSRKGITVEIGNTDAEGRLILGDALTLGGEEAPDLMVSLATLTGAARVALGPELVPFYCDDNALASGLSEASSRVADPVWRMPLWSNYESMLSSQIADVNHISGGSFAGSITAALFLKKFAGEARAWMHFDLYAWRPKGAPGRPAGGEAQAIRALFEVLAARYPAQ